MFNFIMMSNTSNWCVSMITFNSVEKKHNIPKANGQSDLNTIIFNGHVYSTIKITCTPLSLKQYYLLFIFFVYFWTDRVL